MHLIGALAAGIRGAENGSVDIYRRGTPTRVTYYTSFEASPGSAVTPSTSAALDGYGGIAVYVNELVQCVVKDSAGSTVRTFVAGDNASAVEVVSDSFTGTDYVSGASAVSKPTTLQAVLDKWNDSAGANDFKVMLNSTAYTLQALVATLGGFYFSVKSPAYGALGDGVADDTLAIQAACTAANAAGGGVVFFPSGTYRVTSSVNIGTNVSLLGVSSATTIKMDASGSGLWLQGAIGTPDSQCRISGLKFDSFQANSGVVLQWANTGGGPSSRLLVEDCVFGNHTLVNGMHIYIAGSLGLRVRSTTHFMGTSNAAIYGFADTSVTGSTFHWAGQAYTGTCVYGGQLDVSMCQFYSTGRTGGTLTLLASGVAASRSVYVGNQVFDYSSSPLILFSGGATPSYTRMVETGNVVTHTSGYTSNITLGQTLEPSIATSGPRIQLTARTTTRFYVADAFNPTITVDTQRFGVVEIERTSTSACTLNFGQPLGPGQSLMLYWYNNQGSASGTITMDAFVKGLASFTVNANSVSYYYFVSTERGAATRKWTLVGSLVNQTP